MPFPIIEILETSFLTTLLIVFSSMISEITVPGLLLKVDFVIIGILNFSPISTHLLWRTFAPSLDISSISSYDNADNFWASSTLFGSVVYTPSTSENI